MKADSRGTVWTVEATRRVAHAVNYLLGLSGNWISGVTLNVSGGLVKGI